MIQSSAIPISSALLQGNRKAIAFEVERSFEIGVGGDKLDVVRHRVHVVGQKEATGTYQGQHLLQVVDIARLLGIDESCVDGAFHLSDVFVSVALNDRNNVVNTGLLKMLAGHSSATGIELKARELAVCLQQRQTNPGTRIASGGADFNHPLGVDRFDEKAQHPAVRGRNAEVSFLLGHNFVEERQNLFFLVVLSQRRIVRWGVPPARLAGGCKHESQREAGKQSV